MDQAAIAAAQPGLAALVAGLALALGAAGCGRPARTAEPASAGPDRFPLSGTVLQEGDILLSYGRTLACMLVAQYGLPPGRYSHAGVYYRDEAGRGRVLAMTGRGLESAPLEEQATRAGRLALVRLRDDTRAAAIGDAARALWRRDKAEPVRFDHALRRKPDDPSELFCDEMVSYLYRQAGLPDPFAPVPDIPETLWIRRVRAYTGIDLTTAASPNAALSNPQFAALVEVERPGPAAPGEAALSTMLDRIRYYVGEQGYEPAKPSLGSRILIALERDLLRRDFVRRLPSPRQREVSLAMLEYIAECKAKVAELLDTRPKGQWTPERVRALTERVCDAYRDRYFRKAASAR